jgi:hypothetical protein
MQENQFIKIRSQKQIGIREEEKETEEKRRGSVVNRRASSSIGKALETSPRTPVREDG